MLNFIHSEGCSTYGRGCRHVFCNTRPTGMSVGNFTRGKMGTVVYILLNVPVIIRIY